MPDIKKEQEREELHRAIKIVPSLRTYSESRGVLDELKWDRRKQS